MHTRVPSYVCVPGNQVLIWYFKMVVSQDIIVSFLGWRLGYVLPSHLFYGRAHHVLHLWQAWAADTHTMKVLQNNVKRLRSAIDRAEEDNDTFVAMVCHSYASMPAPTINPANVMCSSPLTLDLHHTGNDWTVRHRDGETGSRYGQSKCIQSDFWICKNGSRCNCNSTKIVLK